MFEDFQPPNSNQRKYLSGLFGIASVAWFSPFYDMMTSFYLHKLKFSIEYVLFIIFSIAGGIFFLILGFSILRAIRDDRN